MDNKENNHLQELQLPLATSEQIKRETMRMAYNSGVYTFASRNSIELPERVGYGNKPFSMNMEDNDELNGIFRDVNSDDYITGTPSLRRQGSSTYIRKKRTTVDYTRRNGISGHLLSKPIPIPKGGVLTRQPSMIF